MDLNLDTLKREILGYLETSGFAVFRSHPGGLESLPMVTWDTERYPDYQMFLETARKIGCKMILFAARDFVVLCANPRGTPGYGEEFGSLLRSNDPSDPFDDLMRGADYLVDAGFIDPARINIAGSVVAPWAIGQTERFRSAVAADPIVEFASDPSRDVQRSPIFFAADFKTPTLVIDSGASPGAATLYGALQSRHVVSALVRLPEAQRPSSGVLLLEAMLGWMRK